MSAVSPLHRNDKLWGAVAEALVAAYALIGAAGKLTSYRPYTDVDGKDIIIDLAGGFKDIYVQVKCSLGLNRNHRFGGTVRLHPRRISPDPKFVYIFCVLDRRKMELTRIWVIPAAAFYERAYRTRLANGDIQFNFDCRAEGDEKWDEFETDRESVGLRLVELINRANGGKGRRLPVGQQVTGRWLSFLL